MNCPVRGKGRHRWEVMASGKSRCIFCGLERKATRREIDKYNRIQLSAAKAFSKALIRAFPLT